MSTGWLLYYAMVTSHVCGIAFALALGRAAHRSVAIVIAVVSVIQVALCATAMYNHVSVQAVEVTIDIIDNSVMCAGLLIASLYFKSDSWIIVIMLLSTCLLASDGLVFEDKQGFSQLDFPGAANWINILMMVLLVAATVASRLEFGPPRARQLWRKLAAMQRWTNSI